MPVKVGDEYRLQGTELKYRCYYVQGATSALPSVERILYFALLGRPPIFTSAVQRFINIPETSLLDFFLPARSV